MGAVNDESALSHLDADGRARMVDVSAKPETARRAVASGRYRTRPDVIALLRNDALPKADVLTTARLAGIGGAKRTSDLIPLCHPLPLDTVTIDLVLDGSSVVITASAATTGRTGVEMEALTAVAIAGLTLHDMVKAVDPAGTLTDIRLMEKSGGARGHWVRAGAAEPSGHNRDAPHASVSAAALASAPGLAAAGEQTLEQARAHGVPSRTAVVVVVSTRGAEGSREDSTGPLMSSWLTERGFTVDRVEIVADVDVEEGVRRALESSPSVVLTTGGTGVSPTDRTPEAVAALIDLELPGLAEAIRARGRLTTPTAALSRGVAGIVRGTVIVTLPGSPGGVRDGLAVLDELLDHLLDQLAGAGHHD